MRKLDCLQISAAALLAPFLEWRLLLLSARLPVLLYVALCLCRGVLSPEAPLFLPPTGSDPIASLLWIVPALMFEWRWMTGLWYGAGHHPVPTNQLSYIVLFSWVSLFWLLVDWAPQSIFLWIGDTPTARQDILINAYKVTSIAVTLGTIWATTRLTGWQAAVIDRGKTVPPGPNWHLTRQHFWRLIGIGILTVLPIILFGFALVLALTMLPALTPMNRLALQVVAALTVLYGYAVKAAISLLVYRELRARPDNLSIF
ncbi:hypothetical protein [Dongia sp.]|jgi:hypothetical protein|uniref:hypothetical protein n=1 Tax=Dongia sp. TaxID=1977262 RepID=UPI0035B1071F